MAEVSIRAGARCALMAVAAVVIAACGGGGGGDAGGSTTPPGGGGGGGGGGGAPTNNPPVLGTTTFSATEDTDLSAQLTATDADGDTLTFTKTGDPTSGSITSFTAAGAFVYRPNADANGTDSFAVRVADPVGNTVNGTVTINIAAVNDAPLATNDVMRADGPQLDSIDLVANDRDPDGDALTVTIEGSPLVGTATVGSDGKVRLEGLPGGFRGLNRFRYRITDGGGLSSVATAAVFVGTDPFRAVFAGETGAAGVAEVYMTDFVSPPWRATLATEGSQRLRGFAASDNGATIVYRRENANSTDLSFVRTTTSDSTAAQQVRVALPAGFFPVVDATGSDQFAVSPDGQWIASVARNGNDYAVFAINVAKPTEVLDATPADAHFVTQPRFAGNSGRLYFLASPQNEGDGRKSLYRYDIGAANAAPVVLSRAYNGMNPGDINTYAVAPNQSRIVLEATRDQRLGVFFIDPATPGTEVRLNHDLNFFEALVGSTVGLAIGAGQSTGLERVGYTVRNFLAATNSAYVAEVSATPNPRVVATGGASAVGFRADNDAMLYEKGSQIYEAVIDSTAPQEIVGSGVSGVYDSVGDTLVLRLLSPNNAPALAAATRGAFGVTAGIGTPGQAAWFSDFSAAGRAVLLIGEGPPGGAPRLVRITLVNARAPDKVLPLADFDTPIDLTSGEARIVTY
jgi:hypothetical protein